MINVLIITIKLTKRPQDKLLHQLKPFDEKALLTA
jgi:hypothetical protein